MPYISNKNRRKDLRKGHNAITAGELNYQIFYYAKHYRSPSNQYKVIKTYVDNFLGENPNYQRYNDMTGCLIRCAREIKRRLDLDVKELFEVIIDDYDDEIAKYEDLKCSQNGDIE